jgi:hypothetical protein
MSIIVAISWFYMRMARLRVFLTAMLRALGRTPNWQAKRSVA